MLAEYGLLEMFFGCFIASFYFLCHITGVPGDGGINFKLLLIVPGRGGKFSYIDFLSDICPHHFAGAVSFVYLSPVAVVRAILPTKWQQEGAEFEALLLSIAMPNGNGN